MKFYRITEARPHFPFLHLTFEDGFAGELDLSEVLSSFPIAAPLRDPAIFASVRLAEAGRVLEWEGTEIDFCADALRFQVEEAVVRGRARRFAERVQAAE